MPPKRKRTEAVDEATTATAPRTTRRSARNKAANDQGDDAASTVTSAETASVPEKDPPAKKTRKAPAKAAKASKTSTSKTATKQAAVGEAHAEPGDITNPNEDIVSAPPRTNGKGSSASLESTNAKAKSSDTKPLTVEPYTPARANEMFARYADEDDAHVIGPEGFERLCNDVDIPLDGALPLILAWLVKGDEMAKITRTEWEAGMGELQIASNAALSIALHDFNDLLLTNKPPLKPPTSSPTKKKPAPEPYNRTRYYRCAVDRRKTFGEFYQFCFVLAKPPQARLIDMETGSAFWSVLLVPQYPIMQEILDFITEKGTYRGVNKDLWTMVLDFCRTVSPDLHDYEPDGAWPTMLDEFVTWKKSKSI